MREKKRSFKRKKSQQLSAGAERSQGKSFSSNHKSCEILTLSMVSVISSLRDIYLLLGPWFIWKIGKWRPLSLLRLVEARARAKSFCLSLPISLDPYVILLVDLWNVLFCGKGRVERKLRKVRNGTEELLLQCHLQSGYTYLYKFELGSLRILHLKYGSSKFLINSGI
jgi:hypothetical protein